METRYRLSKTTYMKGMQCPKALYLYKHHYDLQDPISAATQALFDRGHGVGELAWQLFPGGVDLSPERVENFKPMFAEAIARTQEEIGKGTKVLYEATLVHRGVMAALDILVRDGDRWKAYEVKSGSSVKEVYAADAALQHWVLNGAGLDLADISIVHIDTSYVRRGEIDVRGLFAVESVLDHALARQGEIGGEVERLYAIIDGETVPEVPIGPHCSNPYDCSFIGHCWQHVPSPSVFDLSRLGQKKWDLYARGIVRLEDVPDDFRLNHLQRVEVRSAVTGDPHVDEDSVRDFVLRLEHPLYFLDFETVAPAVPLFDGTRPYQAVPFQYSLHRRDARGAELAHSAFLGDGRTDPRPALVEQLLSDVGPEGDILAYTHYERTQLNALIEAVPERAVELQALVDRLVDLSQPFAEHSYYVPAMKGSYSIKAVLPALVPDLSYDGMPIADGQAAAGAYEALHYETDPARIEAARKALLEYCGLDTLAMVRILEVLEGV